MLFKTSKYSSVRCWSCNLKRDRTEFHHKSPHKISDIALFLHCSSEPVLVPNRVLNLMSGKKKRERSHRTDFSAWTVTSPMSLSGIDEILNSYNKQAVLTWNLHLFPKKLRWKEISFSASQFVQAFILITRKWLKQNKLKVLKRRIWNPN